jgi:hypothetical protein
MRPATDGIRLRQAARLSSPNVLRRDGPLWDLWERWQRRNADTPSRAFHHGIAVHHADGLADADLGAFMDVFGFADLGQGASVPRTAQIGQNVRADLSIQAFY